MRNFIILGCILLGQTLNAQNTLKYFEYWFDAEVNQKVQSEVADENSMVTVNKAIETPDLDFGLHLFNYRYCDALGKWSVVQSSFFNKVPNFNPGQVAIVAYEFWMDNRVDESTLITSNNTQLNHSLDVNQIENGLHLFNCRVKDSRGRWSHTHSRFFVKTNTPNASQNQIESYEYWIDHALDNKTVVSLENPVNPFSLAAQIDIPVLPLGDHLFTIRFKDIYGNWSEPQSTPFAINSCYLDKANKPMGEASICANISETEYFTHKVNKAAAYQWHLLPETAGELIMNDTTVMVVWADNFVGAAQVWVNAQNVCGNGENSDTLWIERVALPEKPIIADTCFYEFCDTDSVTFTAPDGFNYAWQNESNKQSLTAKFSGEYFVKITNAYGCFSYSDTITVTTHETPNTPSIMAYGDSEFCLGDSVELGLNNLPKEAFYHVWTTGEMTETIWVKESGKYAHKLVTEFGCESSFSDSVEITVFDNPDIPVITRTENILSAGESYAYQWYRNLAPVAGLVLIDGEINQHFSPTANGIYAVEVFTENGCSEISEAYDFIASAVNSMSDLSVEIFPNPNNGIFTINHPQVLEKIQIQITDISGKIVFHTETSSNSINMDLGHFKGIYFITISCQTKQCTQKLIINQ